MMQANIQIDEMDARILSAMSSDSRRSYADVGNEVGLSTAAVHERVRKLVERGVIERDGGYVWSSDPRLTLPTLQRFTEVQIQQLVTCIECPTQVVYANPPQPYLPEPLRSQRAALLPHGRLTILSGSHHLHMEDPQAVAAVLHDFF